MRIGFVLLLGIVATTRLAGAACNVIPAPREQLVSGPNPNDAAIQLTAAVLAEERRYGGLVPYKGALGRIDRVFMSSDRRKPVRVAVDGHCVGRGRSAMAAIGSTKDLVAAAILEAPARSTPTAVAVTGGGISCDALFPRGDRLTVTQCSRGGITVHSKYASVLELSFPKDHPSAMGRAARIAVFRATAADRAQTMLDRLSTTSCAQLCADDAEGALAACIDTLYAPSGISGNEITYVPDLVKCQVQTIPHPIPWNDFKEICEKDPPIPDLPQCDGGSQALAFWKDGCQGIYIPFDWEAIRDGNDRWVRGQSGISRWGDVKGKRATVPGREYVGVLLEDDLGPDGDWVTNPRQAQIDVWSSSKEEFGFAGVVDKDRSIIHVVPQLATHYVCDDSSASGGELEACMQVPTQLSDPDTRCACRDRYEVGCTCHTLAAGKLFECDKSRSPCTRHDHCNLKPNDTCSAKPKCHEAGAVWGRSGPGLGECWSKADCPAARPQCGYLLFDPQEKIEADGLARLDKVIAQGAARKQRGVCRKTSGSGRKACSNSNAMGADGPCAADDECIGYLLEARGKR